MRRIIGKKCLRRFLILSEPSALTNFLLCFLPQCIIADYGTKETIRVKITNITCIKYVSHIRPSIYHLTHSFCCSFIHVYISICIYHLALHEYTKISEKNFGNFKSLFCFSYSQFFPLFLWNKNTKHDQKYIFLLSVYFPPIMWVKRFNE